MKPGKSRGPEPRAGSITAPPCPSCSAPSIAWAGPDRKGQTYFFCRQCGLAFLDPACRPGLESEKARYLLHRNDPSDPGYAGVLDAFLDSALSPFAPAPASIIDYGCGPVPALAGRARERGYRAAAWDPLFASSERNRTGLFDAALLHEVIEHCFEPSAALADAASLLKPGGILAVSTLFKPESPESFLRWWYREDPTHVCFFSRKSLCATAAFAGLVELACDGRSISVFRLP